MLSEANNRNCNLSDLKVAAEQLVELLDFVDRDEITNLTAKAVLKEMIDTGKPAPIIIQDKNLIQISDIQSLETQVEEAIKENAKSVQDYKSGKNNALMFLVGQVMRKSAGRANPKIVQDILKRRLNDA
jgi:aspartyl-tRNA(Asn)/glutamyl-tRNA(Gln) amidotransferase subunit B